MAKKRIIKPGAWWVVQIRRYDSFQDVARVLRCKNPRAAGSRGSERKWIRKTSWTKDIKRVRRQWELCYPHHFMRGYKFDDLQDARVSAGCKVVQDFAAEMQGIVEIVKVTGCLYYGTVVSRHVVERRFPPGCNEMEVLAIEAALGISA